MPDMKLYAQSIIHKLKDSCVISVKEEFIFGKIQLSLR